MTMVPAQTQTQQQQQHQQQQQQQQQQNGFNLYSGFARNIKNHDAAPASVLSNRFGLVEEEAGSGYNHHHQYLYYNSNNTTNCIGGSTSNHLVSMADEEDSTTNETGSTSIREPPNLNNNELQAGGEASWLRLGIGGGRSNTTSPSLNSNTNNHPQRDTGSMLELNLLPGPSLLPPPPATSFPGLPPPGSGFNPVISMAAAPFLFYQQQQMQQHQGWANYLTRTPVMPNPTLLSMASSSTAASASSSAVIRLIDPPPRPHSGIWFKLQPSVNQLNEPFLPQLPNKYLRIKDGRMTVGLLIKYLVNKLGLESESEVEIRCRGEEVEPNLTMQQVRASAESIPSKEEEEAEARRRDWRGRETVAIGLKRGREEGGE